MTTLSAHAKGRFIFFQITCKTAIKRSSATEVEDGGAYRSVPSWIASALDAEAG
jgi:hypothetical protein